MNIKFRISLLGVAGVVLTALVSSFVFSSAAKEDQISEKRAYINQLLKSVEQTVALQTNLWGDKLANKIQSGGFRNRGGVAHKIESDADFESSDVDFLATAMLSQVAGSWQINSIDSVLPQIDSKWIIQQFNQQNLAHIKGKKYYWMRLVGSDGQVYFGVAQEIQVSTIDHKDAQIALGILPLSSFSDLNLVSMGERQQIFLVNDSGYTMSFPEVQYVGSRFDSHPLVAKLIKGEYDDSVSELKDPAGQSVIGGLVQLKNSNLFVVSTLPIKGHLKLYFRYAVEISFLVFIISGLIFLISFFWSRAIADKIEILEKNIDHLNRNQVSANQDGGSFRPSASSFEDFGKAISLYINSSYKSFLGQIQIVLGTAKFIPKDQMDRIHLSSKKLSDFFDGIEQKFGASNTTLERIELAPIMSQVNSIISRYSSEHGVATEINLKADVFIRADFEQFKTALKTLSMFMISKMDPTREIRKFTINTVKIGGIVEIQIQGMGVLITEEERKNIFKPFKVTLENSNIFDLDLSLAQAVISQFSGDLFFEKIGGDHYQFLARLPLLVVQKDLKEESEHGVNIYEIGMMPKDSGLNLSESNKKSVSDQVFLKNEFEEQFADTFSDDIDGVFADKRTNESVPEFKLNQVLPVKIRKPKLKAEI